jgi:hypothetical protein
MKSPELRLGTFHLALTTILLALNIPDQAPCLMGGPKQRLSDELLSTDPT